jgi:hypothetical protein
MISLALALLLILGVNMVFRATSDTIGTGFALSAVTRNHRAAQNTIARDFDAAVPLSEMPMMIIQSEQRFAFRNRQDEEADADGNASTDNETGPIPVNQYRFRNHRTDRISFFAKDLDSPFPQQTASSPGELISNNSSREAWIWYGHLALPNNDQTPNPNTGYFGPGEQDRTINPNNYYVSNWVLGRMAVLLQDSPAGAFIAAGDRMQPLSGPRQEAPAFDGSNYNTNGLAPYNRIHHSRLDVANTTIREYRDKVAGNDWWTYFDYRFNAKPWPTRSATLNDLANEMALTAPQFLTGCSQFIVEFAGNFDATTPGVDTEPVGGVQRIRWYGMPRDINGDGNQDVGPVPGTQSFQRSTSGLYVWAWTPEDFAAGRGPHMIRITVQIVDREGRLREGQTVTHVFVLRQD